MSRAACFAQPAQVATSIAEAGCVRTPYDEDKHKHCAESSRSQVVSRTGGVDLVERAEIWQVQGCEQLEQQQLESATVLCRQLIQHRQRVQCVQVGVEKGAQKGIHHSKVRQCLPSSCTLASRSLPSAGL